METYWVWEYGLFEKNPKRQDSFNPETTLEVVKAADAQATIAAHEATILKMGENAAVVAKDAMAAKEQVAALQARVQELEDGTSALLNQQSERLAVENEKLTMALSQLAQRTAELEAAKASQAIDLKNNNAYREQVATLQAELERVRGERDHAKKMEAVQKEVADNQTWHVQKLRTLIAALPKVEGAVEVSAGDDGCYILPLWIRCVTKEQADGIAALLQERQKLC